MRNAKWYDYIALAAFIYFAVCTFLFCYDTIDSYYYGDFSRPTGCCYEFERTTSIDSNLTNDVDDVSVECAFPIIYVILGAGAVLFAVSFGMDKCEGSNEVRAFSVMGLVGFAALYPAGATICGLCLDGHSTLSTASVWIAVVSACLVFAVTSAIFWLKRKKRQREDMLH